MTKVVSVAEMKRIEKAADAAGLSYDLMMRNAGAAVAQAIMAELGQISGKRFLILAGKGNNGGDALVAASHLLEQGGQISVYMAGARDEADPHLERLAEAGVALFRADEDQRWRVLKTSVATADIIVDGLLGTGIQLPLREPMPDLLSRIQQELNRRDKAPYVVAVDCPSGIDSDSGETAAETLAADLTVTLAAVKRGLLNPPAVDFLGALVVGEIGLEADMPEVEEVALELVTPSDVARWLPSRPKSSHKGTFGTAVIVAGSINLPGAAALAGSGAYRVGVGLVSLAVPSAIQSLLAPQLPEAIWILLPHEMGQLTEDAAGLLLSESKGASAMLVGPGLGVDDSTRDFMARLLGESHGPHRGKIGFIASENEEATSDTHLGPLVVDADGLKQLAEIPDWDQRLPPRTILTPHPGEMSLLTGKAKGEIQENRVEMAQHFAKKWGHIVVLKGAFTVIAEPEGRSAVLPFATSALATAGTGDVLAGMVVGFLAQGMDAYEASVLAGYLHGRSGELAAEEQGAEAAVVASDLIGTIGTAISELRQA